MGKQFIAGHYRILRKLSSGAFGHTHLAEDTHLPDNKRCVVKQLKPNSADDFTIATAKRLFPREAAILNKLGEHPQIPRLLAHLEEDQEFYLVQEYIKGHDLDHEIKPGTKLEECEVVKILYEILAILTFVHQQKVIHRDIKPSNIMRRTEDGKLFLIDFGAVKEIVTQVSNSQKLTVAIGTKGYMPIEQFRGQPRYCSDIYALGMMAIFALTGIEPSLLFSDRHTGEIKWRDLAVVNPKLADI
ncbi:MAG: serine/threonine-protein kinase, partial [Cyanobacteria bacterium P01_A01_bin.83]